MTCPNCQHKTEVKDVVTDIDRNEIYRKRRCPNCGRAFYTIEFEIVFDEDVHEIWQKYHRVNNKEKKDDT